MPRLRLALPLVALLLAAPVLAESAKEHATAARKAEKAKSYKKALEEWQAAYKIEPNAEYLVGMGDAYAKLGDRANAKKQYDAYISDPLALDTDVVKGKLAALGKAPAGGDDLGLDLSAPAPKAAAAPAGDLGLDLSGRAPKGKGKKDKKAKKGGDDLGLDEPGGKPALGDLGLDLVPPAGPAAKKEPAKVAVATTLDLGLDLVPNKPEPKVAKPLAVAAITPPVATTTAPPAKPAVPPAAVAPKAVVVTTPVPKAPPKAVPPAAIADIRGERAARSGSGSGASRIVAYSAAGLAVGALAVGGFFYSKASQDSSMVAARPQASDSATGLLEQQQSHKNLALAGLLTGLALAGVAGALFAF